MKYKQFILFCFTLVLVFPCFAKREPSWMRIMPLPGNSTYIYARESGEGATSIDALNMAIVHVFENTANRLNVPFDSQRAYAALQSGSGYEMVATQYNIPINVEDYFDTKLKNGNHYVTVLCQVVARRNVAPVWDKGKSATAGDDLPALVKSVFLPGLGQMGKGHGVGGAFTLIGEVSLIGGGVYCSYNALQQLDRMNAYSANHDIDGFLSIKKDFNTWRTISYCAFGAAGILYVWNLVRAYTIKPGDEPSFAFEPSLICTPNAISPSVGFTFRF